LPADVVGSTSGGLLSRHDEIIGGLLSATTPIVSRVSSLLEDARGNAELVTAAAAVLAATASLVTAIGSSAYNISKAFTDQ